MGTTVSLLSSYGRLDDLMSFALARGDYEAVLEHLMQVELGVGGEPGGTTEAVLEHLMQVGQVGGEGGVSQGGGEPGRG